MFFQFISCVVKHFRADTFFFLLVKWCGWLTQAEDLLQNVSNHQWLWNSRVWKAILLSAGHLRVSVAQGQPRFPFSREEWLSSTFYICGPESFLLVAGQFSAGFWGVMAVVTHDSAIQESTLPSFFQHQLLQRRWRGRFAIDLQDCYSNETQRLLMGTGYQTL